MNISNDLNAPNFFFALREDLKENKEFIPTRAHANDTGWDVRAAMEDREPLVIKPFEYVKIPLGFRAFIPEGYWYELKPRSSTFAKKHLHALYGTIDNGFENQAVFAAQYIPDRSLGAGNELIIEFGEAIGQIIPVKLQEMDVHEWSNEDYDEQVKLRAGARGTGGFGSTG